MSMLRKIAATSLITLSLAVTSIATITPAFAQGGHGGGHEGGGHRGGAAMSSQVSGEAGRSGGFAGRDHFSGRFHDDENYLYNQCQSQWNHHDNRLGNPVRPDVCS
ncbi:hypothetical protein DTW90_23005 [Neorhizobium sp. P12A]|uniref:hypothetical protein n=1 Tax=Neorhizobium sp. P12A TaxID=2268027 RepID=UPI0011F056DF|nr:hypothetical protein [Neorhizobium sp. P12A]KAA0695434.1 hypothetical protein DTW90_23005 [Neorhizobium sp. P12A]